MAINVTNIKIKLETGSSDIYLATWEFNATQQTATSSTFKAGDLVSIASGATYYNGVSVPSWVISQKWKIVEVSGDRAVLGQNEAGTNNINSPINVSFLSSDSSSSGTVIESGTLDHYTVKWQYYTGDNVWLDGDSSDTDGDTKYSTYNAPSNAIQIRVTVTPVSTTHTVNDEEVSYWTGTAATKTYSLDSDPPDTPPVPTVTIENYTLTATVDNISDSKTEEIQFEVYRVNKKINYGSAKVITRRAVYTCTITPESDYRVRCRALNIVGSARKWSEWSDFSSSESTIPPAVESIETIKTLSETSVYLSWTKVKNVTGYEIQYATEKRYFDSSDAVQSLTVEANVGHAEVTGLTSGTRYYFRMRAVNDKGGSAWTDFVHISVGKKPSAPTTWSSTSTVTSGNILYLYWVHNSEDNSSQTKAELELTINGVTQTLTIQNTTDKDEADKTSSYTIDTSQYTEGTTILWRVRTAGITTVFGEWSVQRRVDVYAPPTLEIDVTDSSNNSISVLTSLPLCITGEAYPKTQKPIGYYIEITAEESYETVDNTGQTVRVSKGDSVYSGNFDITTNLSVELSAGDISLSNGISYKITCTVSMNSGLTAESSYEIEVEWSSSFYTPNAEIALDKDTYSVFIHPYCIDSGESNLEPIGDVLLSVYRKEFDGSFTEIASDLQNSMNVFVTDPHPALDYARYRIVAKSKTTGIITYHDIPAYPVRGKEVIIQWDEEWSSFATSEEGTLSEQPWNGSMLKLPYNVDVSDNFSPDVSLVEYVGRSHPVSYYGTQKGYTSTWNMDIVKRDKETLYALRRLASYMGDVYVREPSGSGYWANVAVSFQQTHCELVIPVTLTITRVEGGV
jgi:hypothetical protein